MVTSFPGTNPSAPYEIPRLGSTLKPSTDARIFATLRWELHVRRRLSMGYHVMSSANISSVINTPVVLTGHHYRPTPIPLTS